MDRCRTSWIALMLLVSAVGASGCARAEAAEAAPLEADDSVSTETASLSRGRHDERSSRLAGTWFVSATNFSDPAFSGFTSLDEAAILHGDGTLSSLFFDQFLSYDPPGNQVASGVGGVATWELREHDTVRIKVFRFLYLTKSLTTASNPQRAAGYVRGVFTGKIEGHAIKGQLRFQTIMVDPVVCGLVSATAPCHFRPTDPNEVITADITFTRFDPSEGPDLPRYYNDAQIGSFPKK